MKYLLFLLFMPLLASAQNWQTDYEKTLSEARLQNKPVLVVFSGSDWCAPCIKLDKNVWQSAEFKNESAHWLLLKADFPKKKANQLSAELQKQNNALAEKYNRKGNFPLVIVLDNEGKILGKMGYDGLSARAYLDKLIALESHL